MPILNFLNTHGNALQEIYCRDTLNTWHLQFFEAWRDNYQNLADEANREFQLHGPYEIRTDVGHIAIEKQNPNQINLPYILVSANPGYGVMNQRESIIKGWDQANNAFHPNLYTTFRKNYFPIWYEQVVIGGRFRPQNAAWWNLARRFLHMISEITPPEIMQFDNTVDVIGWELWPFHSTRDGFSPIATNNPNHPLAKFARQSIKAALRIQSKAVIVASNAGSRFLENLEFEPEASLTRINTEYIPQTAIHISRYRYEARDFNNIFTINRQIFAGRGVTNNIIRDQIVEIIRNAIQAN